MNNTPVFDFFRKKKKDWTYNRNAYLTQREVDELNAVLSTSAAPIAPLSPVEPRTEPPPLKTDDGLASKVGPLVGIVGALAATSLFASIPEDEGTRYLAYRDIAGITTICQGDTNDVRMGLIETPEGCRVRLERQLVIHAKGVMACTPRLKEGGRDYQRAATVSLAYNIGVGAYCRSSVDRHFDVGDWRSGCNAFLAWNKARVKGVLRPVTGLINRRNKERAICLRGLV